MQVIKGIESLASAQEGGIKKAVVTIGNFDGVHLGHQKIISTAVEKARQIGGTAVGFTFRPHPRIALNPSAQIPLLLTYDEKIEKLSRTGLDLLIEEPFGRQFSTISPEKFFTDILMRRLDAHAIVVGYDFAFGKEREGHLDLLSRLCQDSGVELTVVSAQRTNDEVVSSSRIRQHLLAGDVEGANRLLGEEFFYRGVVEKGEGRGRKIGFPTANLKLEQKLALPYGVYATIARVLRGESRETYPSVTNVGVRPTFQTGDQQLPALIEAHLIDQEIDLYGATLEVRFVRRLRAEKKFSGIDELRRQISDDVQEARKALATAL